LATFLELHDRKFILWHVYGWTWQAKGTRKNMQKQVHKTRKYAKMVPKSTKK